jgi:hypothetical protein
MVSVTAILDRRTLLLTEGLQVRIQQTPAETLN